MFPKQFSGKYPSTDIARAAALKDFRPTKQDREEAWAKENAPGLRVKLEEFMPGLLPLVPLTIISEYAITWVAVPPSPLQEHSASVEAQGSVQNVVHNVKKPLPAIRQPLEDIAGHSGLRIIDPYDGNPDTKYYLDYGCRYLARNHSKKYETESVQQKQNDAYYKNCLHAVWPGSSVETLSSNKCHLNNFDSFGKGDVLAQPDKQPPFVAPNDGFVLRRATDYTRILYYHEDKPPMNLDVLSRLKWPHSRDLLSFRDTEIKTFSARSRKEQSNQRNVNIKIDSKHVKSVTFADLKRWVQSFDLEQV